MILIALHNNRQNDQGKQLVLAAARQLELSRTKFQHKGVFWRSYLHLFNTNIVWKFGNRNGRAKQLVNVNNEREMAVIIENQTEREIKSLY